MGCTGTPHFDAGYQKEAAMSNDWTDAVADFMLRFRQELPMKPAFPKQETMDLRVRLTAEEFCEFLRDAGYTYELQVYHADVPGEVFESYGGPDLSGRSLPKTADACIDSLYVIIGNLLAMGIDPRPLFDAVHGANMAKVGGPVVNGKTMKPDGWAPPDIEGELRKQGWEG